MQLFWKFLLLFMLMHVMFAREVNKRLEEENTDFEINDFFEDEDYEDSAKTDNDKETEDDFLETEDDETTEETFVSRGSELPDHDSEEEKPIADSERCTKEQLSYFPHRLRDWFYIIKQDLIERKEEDQDVLLPLKESDDSELDRKWVEAVLWKFCDLDTGNKDRYLSKEELLPLRDPLVSMEPCIDPFLADCDSNYDTHITLHEWGNCFGLKYDVWKMWYYNVSMEPCIDPFLADCDSNDDTHITLHEWGNCFGLKYGEIKYDCKAL